jgi:hypothetical protein
MRKSLVVLLSLAGVAIALVAAALSGRLSDRAIAIVLCVAGISLIASRKQIVPWAHSVGAKSSLLGHWQLLRPFTVALVGSSLILFAGIALIEAARRA